MTIKDYQAARQISYDQAYRAIKYAIEKRGGEMGVKRRGTVCTPEDFLIADLFRADLGTYRQPRVKPADREAQFQALRKEWIEKWSTAFRTGDNLASIRKAQLTVLGFLGEATTQEDVIYGVLAELSGHVLELAKVVGVDENHDGSFVGFTKFLIDSGV